MSQSDLRDPIQGDIVHEYDGILEADNRLPNWWLSTFYGGVAFALSYWLVYESFELGAYPREQYAAAMVRRASESGAVTDELLTLMASRPEIVSRGETTFATNCAACHGAGAEGNIGPNLTDAFWIRGGDPLDIHRTVEEGSGAAGMPAWGSVLGPRGVQEVVAYVLSVRGAERPGREPQGERWTPGGGAPAARLAPSSGAEAYAEESPDDGTARPDPR